MNHSTRMTLSWLILAALLVGCMILCIQGCIMPHTVVPGDPGEGGAATRPAPFGMSWGAFLLGTALGMFLLSLFIATRNELAAIILTGAAVVAASLGFVATTEKEITWGLRVLVVLGMVGLGTGGVVLVIRLWRHFRNLAADSPNTPATNKLVETAKKQNGEPASSAPPESAASA